MHSSLPYRKAVSHVHVWTYSQTTTANVWQQQAVATAWKHRPGWSPRQTPCCNTPTLSINGPRTRARSVALGKEGHFSCRLARHEAGVRARGLIKGEAANGRLQGNQQYTTHVCRQWVVDNQLVKVQPCSSKHSHAWILSCKTAGPKPRQAGNSGKVRSAW